MQTETITLTRHWKVVTNQPGIIQFNDKTQLYLTSGLRPEGKHGFSMNPGQFFEVGENVTAWAKVINPITKVPSLRVTKERKQEAPQPV